MLNVAVALLLLAPVLSAAVPASPALPAPGDLEARAPSPGAPGHKWFQSTSKAGLHYAWLVPPGYDGKSPRNLSVILHGTGLDYRWGPANNPAGVFRPDDIVVSVDGTSPGQGDSKLFLGEKKDSDAFAAFVGEMKSAFAVKHVFLYGHSQGGFFVVYFAGEHPELVSGVVAHSSGAWNWSKMTAPVKKVAIAFMHGTLDPVVPYGQSPGSRDAYAKAGFELLHLRRLEHWNHWPNAVRATECLDWCTGISTDDPTEALAAAKSMLRVKKIDEYQWETTVDFSGARAVLRRFESKGSLATAPADVVAEAAQWSKKIEEHAAKHVQALEKTVGSRKDLKLEKASWLGHLVPLREDMRGIDALESFVKKIGYDETLEQQQKAAGEIFRVWYANDPKKTFETVVAKIGAAFLVEGYPPELAAKMAEWKNDATKLGIGAKDTKKFAEFEAWRDGWTKGLEQYHALWKDWKGP
jgi:predicted esterase